MIRFGPEWEQLTSSPCYFMVRCALINTLTCTRKFNIINDNTHPAHFLCLCLLFKCSQRSPVAELKIEQDTNHDQAVQQTYNAKTAGKETLDWKQMT